MENLLHPALIWFFVGIGLFLLEMVTPAFVILFFGIGAWVVSILLLFVKLTINYQLVVFIVSSILSLVVLRKIFKKIFLGYTGHEQNPEQNFDEFSGEKAVVKEPISASHEGRVELNGTLWTAEAKEDIAAGETVRIIKKENLTLKVKKI